MRLTGLQSYTLERGLVLILQDNRLIALPESLGNLLNLTDLDLRNNRLTSLPESLGQLQKLRYLDLRANALWMLPTSLSTLRNLEKLDLRWNKLAMLPEWTKQLERQGCTIYVRCRPAAPRRRLNTDRWAAQKL
jgi:leucine-rich repeat protein SHOC2